MTRDELAAECTDVTIAEDDQTTWCFASHPEFGPVCLSGRTEAIALRKVGEHFRRLQAARDADRAAAAFRETAGDCYDHEDATHGDDPAEAPVVVLATQEQVDVLRAFADHEALPEDEPCVASAAATAPGASEAAP